jgi:sulfur carrier protein ThiS
MSRPDRGRLLASVHDRPFSAQARRVEIPQGATLEALAVSAVSDPVLRSHLAVVVNGEAVARERWGEVRPIDGDVVELAVRAAGGGQDGNKFIRSLLQIAVIAVAAWVGAGAGGAIASSFWAKAAAATVAVAGNLAINALVPPYMASFDSERPDTVYSIEGARNGADPWGPVLVPFGRVRVFPKLQAQTLRETVGDDVYLRMLFSAGPMPLEIEPGSMRLGETPVSEYQGVEIETRLKPDDPPLTLFTRTPFTEVVGVHLTPAVGFTTRVTQPDCTEFVVVIAFPQGLGGKDSRGRNIPAGVTLDLQYQPVASDPVSDPWFSARPTGPQANEGVALIGETRTGFLASLFSQLNDAWIDQLQVANGSVTFTRAEAGKPFSRELRAAVPQGQYRVRVRRVNAEADDDKIVDRAEFAFLISIDPSDPLPREDHAGIALRIKASDQLAGQIDTFNYIAVRHAPRLDPAILDAAEPDFSEAGAGDWDDTGATRSPADAALFGMRGPMAVNPTPDDAIDWPSAARFARWCKDNGFTFDHVLDRPMRRADFVRMACAAGRARPVRVNGRWRFVIDGPDADGPVQMFTARNVRNFRAVRSFPAETHALRVRFANAQADFRQDERQIFLPGWSRDGAEPGTQAATLYELLDIPGVLEPDNIWKLGSFYAATALTQTERFTFEVGVERLVCTFGSWVRLAHDVMVTGLGAGRVRERILDGAGDVAGVRLDETFTMEAGSDYGLTWRRVVDLGGGRGRFAAEGSIPVVTAPGETQVLMFAQALAPAEAPAPGDLAAFGLFGEETVDALVRNIRPRPDGEAELECVIRAASRFTADQGPIPGHTPPVLAPIRRRPPAPVLEAVSASEAGIFVTWSVPAGFEDRISRTELSWRRSPEEGVEASWTDLPALSPEIRTAGFEPENRLDLYDIRLRLVDAQGRYSDPPLLVTAIAADNVLPAPASPFANGVLTESASGVRVPALEISAAPDERLTLTELEVAIRPASSSDPDDFQTLTLLSPARPLATVRDVPAGATVDVGLRYRAQRGTMMIEGPWAIVQDVAIPGELVASDAGGVGGRPADLVIAAIDLSRDELNAGRDRLNEARGVLTHNLSQANQTFEFATAQMARQARLGAHTSLLNWIQDPLFETGVSGWRASGGLLTPEAGPDRGLRSAWSFSAPGRPSGAAVVWPERRPVEPDKPVQAACEIACRGAAGEALLEIVWYDAAGAELSASPIERKRDGRLSGVATAPAGAALAGARLAPIADRAGDGSIALRRPLIAYALPGQSAADAFSDPESEVIARIAELERTTSNLARRERTMQVESRRGRATAREIFLLQADEGGSLAGYDLTLNAQFETVRELAEDAAPAGSVFTQAQANQRFLLQADEGGSLAGYDLTLNAQFETVRELAEDAAPAGSVFTQAQANQRFLLQANEGGSLAGYDLTLNAQFETVRELAEDAAPAGSVFTQAQANQRFLLQADEGGSLAGYDLTLNAQFTTTQREAIQAAEAAVVGQVEANQRFLLQADEGGSLAGYDLTLNAQFETVRELAEDAAPAGSVFTQAQANQRFLLQADEGGSLAGYDLTLNAQFETVRELAEDAAPAGSVFTQAQANQRFLLQADEGGSLAGYDLTLNAQFTTTQREAIQAAEAAVVGQVEANQRFLLRADEGGSLAGYDLTLNAQYQGLDSSVQQLGLATADLEERTASYWIRVQAGAGEAFINLYAEDVNGVEATLLKQGAKAFWWGVGPNDADRRVQWDFRDGHKFMRMYGPNGTTIINDYDLATGVQRWYRASDGVEMMNTVEGVLLSALPPATWTQGPAETTSRVGSGALGTSWETVAEVNLNSLPDGGRFVCDFACALQTRSETSAFQPASGEVRIIAVKGASTEQIGAVATWAQNYTIIPPEDDGPTLYRATTPPVQSTRVKAQPFTGDVIFRMQARRTDSFGSGAAATVGGVYLSARRTP